MIGSLFVTGPAGTGKSTFCGTLSEWLQEQQMESATVNLDPGADFVPYEVDVDIRDYISLSRVMQDYSLGPNGAQVVAADLMVEYIPQLKALLEDFQDHYVIFDTPGQVELFTFRQGSTHLVDALTDSKAMIAYLADSVVASSPSGFIAQKMLFGSIFYRFFKPTMFIINKSDLITTEDISRIGEWEHDPGKLSDDLLGEKQQIVKQYYAGIIKAFADSELISKIIPVSSVDRTGIEEVYSELSNFFTGGEDTDTMYRDE